MFKVEYHFLGEGLWSKGGLPMTQLGAAYVAETLKLRLLLAHEVRVVPAEPPEVSGDERALDIRV